MTITVYKSTDSSAPVLSGTAGSLISILDACLVNGYGTKAAAGWTKEYSGTNLAAYRMTTTSPATGMYLRVDDTDSRDARLVGYETMSDISTGTGPFPAASVVGGQWMPKSDAVSSTSRPWVLIATNRSFYFFSIINTSTTYPVLSASDRAMFFGDLVTRKAVDGYECLLMAPGNAYNNQNGVLGNCQSINSSYAVMSGHYLARGYTGTGSSIQVAKGRNYKSSFSSSTLGASVTGGFPNSITNSINFATVTVAESGIVFRGFLPGFYEIIGGTNSGFRSFDEFTGSGTMSGKNLIVIPVTNTSVTGYCSLQTNGSWY
jgi:hypothetical protein